MEISHNFMISISISISILSLGRAAPTSAVKVDWVSCVNKTLRKVFAKFGHPLALTVFLLQSNLMILSFPYSYPRPTAASNAILAPSAEYNNNNNYYDHISDDEAGNIISNYWVSSLHCKIQSVLNLPVFLLQEKSS